MPKAKTKRPSKQQLDSVYILKLVLYLILGSLWFRFTADNGRNVIPLPVGAIIGLAFASHEHFKIDRKVEYAVLLVAMFIGFWLPMGVSLAK